MSETIVIVKVGIADMKIHEGFGKIRTSGLGSCVGVVIYDLAKHIAGMAHVMLPDSQLTQQKEFNDYKFADTAIEALINDLIIKGARKFSLKAKIAGGAQMFAFQSTSEITRIGPRNVAAVKDMLKKFNIPILAEDVGGNRGRTIEFDVMTGALYIRTVNKSEQII